MWICCLFACLHPLQSASFIMIDEFCELNSMLLSDDLRTAELQRKKSALVIAIQQQEERFDFRLAEHNSCIRELTAIEQETTNFSSETVAITLIQQNEDERQIQSAVQSRVCSTSNAPVAMLQQRVHSQLKELYNTLICVENLARAFEKDMQCDVKEVLHSYQMDLAKSYELIGQKERSITGIDESIEAKDRKLLVVQSLNQTTAHNINELTVEMQSLLKEISAREKNHDELVDIDNCLNAERLSATTELDELTTTYTTKHNSLVHEIAEQVHNLEIIRDKDLVTVNSCNAERAKELEDVRQSIQDYLSRIERYKISISSAEELNALLRTQIEGHEFELAAAVKDFERIGVERELRANAKRQLNQEISTEQHRITTLTSDMPGTFLESSEADALSKRLQEKSDAVASLKQHLEELIPTIEHRLPAELISMQNDYKESSSVALALSAVYDSFQTENERMDAINKQLTCQLPSCSKKEANKAKKSQRMKMTLAEKKCNQLRSKLHQLQADITANRATYKQMQQQQEQQQERTQREQILQKEHVVSMVQLAADQAKRKCQDEVTQLQAALNENDMAFKSMDKHSKVLDADHAKLAAQLESAKLKLAPLLKLKKRQHNDIATATGAATGTSSAGLLANRSSLNSRNNSRTTNKRAKSLSPAAPASETDSAPSKYKESAAKKSKKRSHKVPA